MRRTRGGNELWEVTHSSLGKDPPTTASDRREQLIIEEQLA